MNLKGNDYMILQERLDGYGHKRRFYSKDTRCMQSKINLKFPIKNMLKEKQKSPIQIKEGIIKEFDKRYKETCNQ